MLFTHPLGSLQEHHWNALECMRLMWHRELGTAAALFYCSKHSLRTPPWLAERAPVLLSESLSDAGPKRRGRSSNPIARYRQDMIDHTRWEVVRDSREHQASIREQVDELRSRGAGPDSMLRDREKMLAWVGSTWLRAYECASMILTRTGAAGSPEAMKNSYLQVKRESRKRNLRYHILDADFLTSVGLDINFEKDRPRIPYYDLTL